MIWNRDRARLLKTYTQKCGGGGGGGGGEQQLHI